MKRRNVVLAVLVALLVVVGAFEVYMFSTYRMELVNGLIGLVVPSESTPTVAMESDVIENEEPSVHPSPSTQAETPPLYPEEQTSDPETEPTTLQTKSAAENEVAEESTPEPEPTPEIQQQSSGGATVYITNTGSKYHSGWCRYLFESRIPISLSAARAQGYEPCKVCRRGS